MDYRRLAVGVNEPILSDCIDRFVYVKLVAALGNMLPQGRIVLSAQCMTEKVADLLGSPDKNVRVAAAQCLVQLASTSLPL